MKETRALFVVVLSLVATRAVEAQRGFASKSGKISGAPVIVASIAGVDTLYRKTKSQLLSLHGARGASSFESQWRGTFGAESIPGLDGRRRAGVYLRDWNPSSAVVFLPVSDEREFLTLVASKLPVHQQQGGGLYQISGPRTVFFRCVGSWGFAALDRNALTARLPDPTRLVTAAAREHDFAVSCDIHAIPESFQGGILKGLASAAATPLPPFGRGNDAYRRGHAFGQQFVQKLITSTFRELFRGGRELTVGGSLGGARGIGVLECFLSAREGSRLASTFESFRGPASRFDGLNQLRKNIVLTAAMPVSREQQNRLSEGLYKLRSVLHTQKDNAKERKEVEKVFEICDLLEQHFRGGKIDLGLVVDVRPDGRFAVAVGLHTPKAKQLEKVASELTALVRESSSSGRYGRKSYRGTTVNEVYLTKLTKSDRKVLGDRPCVRYAFTKDMILASFGHDRMAALELKGLFDVVARPSRPSRTPRPLQLHIHLRSLMEAAILEFAPGDRDLRQFLQTMGHRDRLSLVLEAPAGALEGRAEIEEGIIKACMAFSGIGL